MRILVNGDPHEAPAPLTLGQLLTRLDLDRRPVAVELNAEVVPREQHASRQLQDGDELEVVTLAGGG